MKTIYLAGGCFWGTQRFFDQFKGVIGTSVGYANGGTGNPSYQDVCRGSGHAETVRIDFDEEKLSLTDLLEYYFMAIDPTSVNRQGGDSGIQYRTGIYYSDENMLPEIEAFMLRKRKEYTVPLAVEVGKLLKFYDAEEYHQKYLIKNPGGYCHIPDRLFSLENGADS